MPAIAITGVGGLLGRRLVTELEQRPDVERIVGIDRTSPQGLTAHKLAYREVDVRDPDLAEVFAGVDVVVHLAFQMDPIHDEAAMRSINIDGTRNVVTAAELAGVGHIVYPSSVVAYGAHPDNDVPLTEDSPLRGIPGFNYAEHKREIEEWLAPKLEAPHDGPVVTVLRLAALLGPGVDNFITRTFEAPRLPAIKGHRPPLQFLHHEDALSAILHVIDHRLAGAYNVGSEGWLSYEEVAGIVGRGLVELPEEVAYSTLARLWSLGIGEQPPGLVELFAHPWVMSSAKLVESGWRPQHTNRDALATMAAEHAPYVTLVGVRTRWATLRLIGAVGALASALVGWRLVAAARRAQERRRCRGQDELASE